MTKNKTFKNVNGYFKQIEKLLTINLKCLVHTYKCIFLNFLRQILPVFSAKARRAYLGIF